jgi:hypothetical protein
MPQQRTPGNQLAATANIQMLSCHAIVVCKDSVDDQLFTGQSNRHVQHQQQKVSLLDAIDKFKFIAGVQAYCIMAS